VTQVNRSKYSKTNAINSVRCSVTSLFLHAVETLYSGGLNPSDRVVVSVHKGYVLSTKRSVKIT
jgi:hypothetical protein